MTAPKLRFKEFNGDWLSLKYKDVLTIKYGKDHKLLEEGNIPVYGTGGIMRYANRYLYDGESILIGRKGTIDQPKYVNEKFWTVDTLFYTEIKNNAVPLFLFQHSLQVNWLGLNEATGVPSLNTTSINNVDIGIPPKEEQTKIATFLSAVDEKISQLNQKHQLLSQYKQGMMQKLFSQQLRFKADDGSEFGEWEDSKLGELTTVITKGTTPSSLGEKFEESGINFIKIESLSSNGKFLLDKFAYIDENTHNKLARSKLDHDDILFSIAGALGRVAIISRDYLPANTNQALAIIRLKDKKITRYIYYFLNSDYVKKIIDAESVQLAQANFSLGQLANLDVLVPCLEEQTKISNFLSSIDQKIEVVAQQIEQAKQWKKGLLQQMFV